jgi:indole-3-glycerol phosphate synthase
VTHLDELVADARRRVRHARDSEALESLVERALDRAEPPSFAEAIAGPGVAVIAEVKRASPSRGPIAPDLDAAEQARAYRGGGAAAVSVLTQPDRFSGSLDDLAAVSAVGIPTLRKDFIIDPYQVWEARAAGASAVLLIVAALDADRLNELLVECADAGLDALVEVHDETEAGHALDAGAVIIGVNARDLRTFRVDRGAFARLRPRLGDDVIAVDESGIRGPEDVGAARRNGADAVLVGEAVVTADDPRTAVALLVSAGATPVTATEYR